MTQCHPHGRCFVGIDYYSTIPKPSPLASTPLRWGTIH